VPIFNKQRIFYKKLTYRYKKTFIRYKKADKGQFFFDDLVFI